MLGDIVANNNGEVLWWGKLDLEAKVTQEAPGREKGDNSKKIDESGRYEQGDTNEFPVHFVEAAACGNDESVLAHFPYMERGDVVLHNHPSGPVQPSSADLQVAGQLARQGIGFYIVDNRLEHICVVSKPVMEAPEQLLEADSLSDLLGPAGPLARIASEKGTSYEQRPMQQESAAAGGRRRSTRGSLLLPKAARVLENPLLICCPQRSGHSRTSSA